MGMDVYGRNPTASVGRYFRRNISAWALLWDYCCSVSSLARQVTHGYTNDGDGLDAAEARSLAKTLQGELENGRTSEYIAQREKMRAELPDQLDEPYHVCEGTAEVWPMKTHYHLNEKGVRDFVVFLEHCGGFKIW